MLGVDIPSDLVITITDVRRAGYCARGTKPWFQTHGLDFRAFLKDGLPAADLLATGCGLVERVIALKLARGA